MHLIVTRPQADSDRLKSRLQANGHTASVVPLLMVRADDDAAIPDNPWQAVAVTSANALTALAGIGIPEKLKTVPMFAVGPASAKLAGELGFAQVRQAKGDMVALQDLMKQDLKPEAGPILYLTGKVRSGDLAGDLQSHGFRVERIELYEAVAATRFPPHAGKTIRSGNADAVVLYSARTADIWLKLVRQSKLQAEAAKLTHLCLSQAVAEKISSGLGRNVSIVVSDNPDDDSMLEAVEKTAANQSAHNAPPGKGATMANRKTPSRKAKKPARPTVIDAKATEVKSAETEKSASPQEQKSGSAPTDAASGKTAETGKPAEPDKSTTSSASKAAARDTTKSKPVNAQSSGGSAPVKKSGKGKLITGALVATLLAGVAVGGYLYREHGTRLFGSTAPVIDVGAIEGQALEAIGTAKSASETADTALAQTKTLTDKIAGLEQQLTEARNSATPDAGTLAAINTASELAGSAKSEIDAVSAKTGEIETGMAEVRTAVASLKSALQTAASTGGGAGQAEVNLKFDELAQRIAKLETAQAQPADDKVSGEVAALRDQLAAATGRMEKLEQQLEAAVTSPKPEVSTAASPPSAAVDTTRVAAQLAALSDTVNQGKSYQEELSALEETAGLTLSLPALSANAASGIKTADQLKQDLGELKAELDAAASESSVAQTPSGWWGTITGKLSSVVKVRKIDGTGNWAEHAASAVTAFETGGLSAAIAALGAGGASAPEPVAAWIVEARKRQGADQDLQKLPQIILGQLPAPAQ